AVDRLDDQIDRPVAPLGANGFRALFAREAPGIEFTGRATGFVLDPLREGPLPRLFVLRGPEVFGLLLDLQHAPRFALQYDDGARDHGIGRVSDEAVVWQACSGAAERLSRPRCLLVAHRTPSVQP